MVPQISVAQALNSIASLGKRVGTVPPLCKLSASLRQRRCVGSLHFLSSHGGSSSSLLFLSTYGLSAMPSASSGKYPGPKAVQ